MLRLSGCRASGLYCLKLSFMLMAEQGAVHVVFRADLSRTKNLIGRSPSARAEAQEHL